MCNVYDAATASIIASKPSARAIATASAAVAAVSGTEDEALTFEANIASVQSIAPVALRAGKPLTVDIQDGYGERLEEAIAAIIKLGAVGCNLEDRQTRSGTLLPLAEAAKRVQRAVAEAERCGVPHFHVNARTDTLVGGGKLADAIERGRAYLAAGAGTVFVWGGPKRRTLSRDEIEALVDAFDGRLNIMLTIEPGGLKVADFSRLGVARISVGPGLFAVAMRAYEKAAEELLGSGEGDEV